MGARREEEEQTPPVQCHHLFSDRWLAVAGLAGVCGTAAVGFATYLYHQRLDEKKNRELLRRQQQQRQRRLQQQRRVDRLVHGSSVPAVTFLLPSTPDTREHDTPGHPSLPSRGEAHTSGQPLIVTDRHMLWQRRPLMEDEVAFLGPPRE